MLIKVIHVSNRVCAGRLGVPTVPLDQGATGTGSSGCGTSKEA